MTSNIGSLHLLEGLTGSGEIPVETRPQVMGELRAHFRPEFLNRVDEIVLFKPLTLDGDELVVSWRNPEDAVELEPVGAGA